MSSFLHSTSCDAYLARSMSPELEATQLGRLEHEAASHRVERGGDRDGPRHPPPQTMDAASRHSRRCHQPFIVMPTLAKRSERAEPLGVLLRRCAGACRHRRLGNLST